MLASRGHWTLVLRAHPALACSSQQQNFPTKRGGARHTLDADTRVPPMLLPARLPLRKPPPLLTLPSRSRLAPPPSTLTPRVLSFHLQRQTCILPPARRPRWAACEDVIHRFRGGTHKRHLVVREHWSVSTTRGFSFARAKDVLLYGNRQLRLRRKKKNHFVEARGLPSPKALWRPNPHRYGLACVHPGGDGVLGGRI